MPFKVCDMIWYDDDDIVTGGYGSGGYGASSGGYGAGGGGYSGY